MSGQVCKAAICSVFVDNINKSVDLILQGHISEEGIDEFIEMSEKMEKMCKKWEKEHINF